VSPPDVANAAGLLVLVPTPIGHLGDLTVRTASVLAEADFVLAEDTRRARVLLSHLGIRGKAVYRLDAHRERESAAEWAGRIATGQRAALLSDAGTPGVSDPGAALVRACATAGVPVQALPGPSAVTTAVSVSGLCSGGFTFLGFVPRAGIERAEAVAKLSARPEAVVVFESARRLGPLLALLAEQVPARDLVICRELSKLHEQVLRGTVAELAGSTADTDWRGEVTLVLGPAPERPAGRWSDDEVDRRLAELQGQGLRAKDAARALALASGWSVRELYARSCAAGRPPRGS
jgi:16S rRNA (cytidine1402-2'-O)-methyltransferase